MNRIKEAVIFFILFILSSVLSFSGAFAEQVNMPLSITVQCTNSTYANLTYAKYIVNSMYILTEKQMTKNGIYYNYTIPSDSINQTGTIEYGYKCDVNGQEYSAGNRIFINLMGEELTSGQGLLYVTMLIGLLLILIITFYGVLAIPWRNNRDENERVISINDFKYLKIVLAAFVYLEMLFIVSILKNLSGYLMNEGIYSFFNMIYLIMLICILPAFFMIIFFTIVLWLSDKKTLKAIQRGLPVR